MADLTLPVRFLRHGTDDGVECVEAEIVHEEREWSVPVAQSALVLVDCWAEHFIRTHQESSGRIMRETLAPVVAAARRAGVAIIHAPSPNYLDPYPQSVAYASDRDLGLEPPPPAPSWPPAEFRSRQGEYAAYARPPEPKVREWLKDMSRYRIAEVLAPQPGDYVIRTGEQLHRLLTHQRRLHLFYAGFATNMCILYRDYGTREMGRRGYNILLLRDCTDGIECRETREGRTQTQAAILSIEVGVGCSVTSTDFLQACAATRSNQAQ
jgi:nicotinamidase-related amidase